MEFNKKHLIIILIFIGALLVIGASCAQADSAAKVTNKKATVKINSYYEQEYKLDLKLMKNEEVLKTIHLNLNRFAFAGNAGNLSLVDDNNNQCMGGPTDNCYYSTEYRGEPDVFYTTGETIALNNYFEWSIQRFEDTERLEGDTIVNPETVYEANKDFHPWAIAMFYNAHNIA